jgi:release factor glutamine methyltransferase
MEHVTGKNKTDRIIHKTIALSNEQLLSIEIFTQQLLLHTPLQYVLNEAWFAGMQFFVNENVLIPRPETEELVEWVCTDVQQNSNAASNKLKVLEIGAGSGCISISLYKKMKEPFITALDVSEAVLDIAKRNALTNDAEINFIQFDFLEESQWKTLPVFDLIVSNPPYIKTSESSTMHQNVLGFEPHLALFVPDNDALLFYRKIALFGKDHLQKNGLIYVEINEALGNETAELFTSNNYTIELKKDLQGKDRMLKAIKKCV